MRYGKLLFSGAVVLAFSTICSADVANGGFETGDLTGWTPGGDLSVFWNLEVTNQGPDSGTYAAHFGAYGNLGDATLSQTFATAPGAYYEVTFFYGEYNQNGALGQWGYLNPDNISTDPSSPYFQANELDVFWDNGATPSFSAANFFTSNQPASGTDPDGGTSPGDYFYLQETFLVQALSSSSTLEFAAFDQQQDVILDDVSVRPDTDIRPLGADIAPVPEPSSFAAVAALLASVGIAVRRKKRQQQA